MKILNHSISLGDMLWLATIAYLPEICYDIWIITAYLPEIRPMSGPDMPMSGPDMGDVRPENVFSGLTSLMSRPDIGHVRPRHGD